VEATVGPALEHADALLAEDLALEHHLERALAEELLEGREAPPRPTCSSRRARAASPPGRGCRRGTRRGGGIPFTVFEPLGAPKLRQAGVRVDTGLGLAFSRVASEALGAVLSVESDGKSGTSFHLLLPAGVPRGSTSVGTLPRRSWGRQAPGEFVRV
jgi:hypothetical protein